MNKEAWKASAKKHREAAKYWQNEMTFARLAEQEVDRLGRLVDTMRNELEKLVIHQQGGKMWAELIGAVKRIIEERDGLRKQQEQLVAAMGEEWPLLEGYEKTGNNIWRHCPECHEWETHPLKEIVGHKPNCTRGKFFVILKEQL